MTKLFYALTVLASGLYSLQSSAQIFKLNLNLTDTTGIPASVIQQIEAEVKKAEDKINDGLPKSNSPNRLMEGMANSSVMAGKGVGSDYASHMNVFLIGAGVGVGADLEKDKETKSDLSGAGVQGGLLIGTNLSWMDTATIFGLDTNRINIYANYFQYSLNQKSKDNTVTGKLSTYGFHTSYDWIPRSPSKLWGWGGVKVHTGYEYNKMDIGIKSKINESIEVTDSGTTISSTITGNPFAHINVATHSIPIEISTSLRFLYAFSLYGGLGADLNFGSAIGKGDLNSSPSNVECTSGVCSGNTIGTVDAEANIDGRGKVKPFTYRGFAGFQFHLPYFLVYVQADKELSSNLVGASVGARFSF